MSESQVVGMAVKNLFDQMPEKIKIQYFEKKP